MIACTLTGDADQFINNRRAFAVGHAGPILVDQIGLARADDVGAVVIVDKEEPFIAINHGGKDLFDLLFGLFVIRRGVAVDEVEAVTRLRDVVA